MQIHVYASRNPPARPADLRFPHVRLYQDNWDDFGHKSTFAAQIALSENETVDLGGVKIARGAKGCRIRTLPIVVDGLGSGVASLGQSIAYYRKLGKMVPDAIRHDYVRTMGDVVSDPAIKAAASKEEIWETSLLRETSARHAADRGGFYVGGPFIEVSPPKFTFDPSLPGATRPMTVEMDYSQRRGIPNRKMLLVGRNGTGKTRTLASLAVALLPREVFLPKTIAMVTGGSTSPKVTVSRVIAISYNAFDEFPLPAQSSQGTAWEGASYRSRHSYKYCGIRTAEGTADVGEIATMLDAALGPVAASEREGVLERVLTTLLDKPLAAALCGTPATRAATLPILSAGQRLVAAIFCNIIGFIEEGSLLLVDEPETHLHPGLLTSVSAAFDDVLEEFDSYAVMATHSPILLQQVPSQFVRVFRRADGVTSVSPLTFESFGEDIGELSRNVLGLADPERDFTHVLRRLFDENGSAEAVEGLFAFPLGLPAKAFLYGLEDEHGLPAGAEAA